MSKLNMKEWINEIIQKKEVVAMPIMTHPGIEMIGKTVRDAVTDGQVHYNAIQALSEKYPTAAATVIMDLTVEAEAFGAEIVFPENEVPSVVGRLLNDEEAIDKLEIPALNKGRIPQYLKANMLAAKAITDRPVFAGCIGPYSLAGRLYDMSEIMMLIYINPEAANSLLQRNVRGRMVLCIFFTLLLSINCFVAVSTSSSPEPYREAADWLYTQSNYIFNEDTLIISTSVPFVVDGWNDYYISRQGRRNSLNVVSQYSLQEENIEPYNRVYLQYNHWGVNSWLQSYLNDNFKLESDKTDIKVRTYIRK